MPRFIGVWVWGLTLHLSGGGSTWAAGPDVTTDGAATVPMAAMPAVTQGATAGADALEAHSPDGRWTARAVGGMLQILDGQGRAVRQLRGTDLAGTRQGRAQRVLALPHRRSFLVAWTALEEWWELSWDPQAPPVFDGLVHDYRMGEAIAAAGFLHPRRIPLPAREGRPVTLEAAPEGQPWAVGVQGDALLIVHLDVRRSVLRTTLSGARLADAAWQPADATHPARAWIPGSAELLQLAPLHGGVLSREPLPASGPRLSWDPAQGLRATAADGRAWLRRAPGIWEPVPSAGTACTGR